MFINHISWWGKNRSKSAQDQPVANAKALHEMYMGITELGSSSKDTYEMYMAITELGLWSVVAANKPKDGYMFATDKYIGQIMKHPRVEKCGHSAASFAFFMNHMKYIADHGLAAFFKKVTENRAAPKVQPRL